jgi:hypothetical protein
MNEIATVLDRWRDAECRGDRAELDAVLAEEFVGVGPVGFVLRRDAWLDRFGPDLRYDDLELDEIDVRSVSDGTSVVIAHQHARGEAQGNPLPEETRVSFVVVDRPAGPRIAGIQYSFMVPA